MPEVTKDSQFLVHPDRFSPATKLYQIMVSVSVSDVIITRLEGWYGKTKQKVEVEREYKNVSVKSLRRLHRVLTKLINDNKVTIQISHVGRYVCYEVNF